MDAELLEWFRVDRSRGTRRLLGTGGVLVFVGASLVGGAFLTHQASSMLAFLTLTGAAMLAFGLILAFGGMVVLLAHDQYVAVRTDGIVFHDGSVDEVIAWTGIEAVECDGELGWVIRRATGDARKVSAAYAGVGARELAEHLEQLRLKARMGTLETADVARIAIGLPHKRPGAARF